MRMKQSIFEKAVLMSCLLLFVLGGQVFSTISWLTREASVSNAFVLGNGDVSIKENFDSVQKIKSNVYVANDAKEGSIPVYVRAQYLIYWEDADGNVLPEVPVGTGDAPDYTLVLGTSTKWKQGADGFFYYTEKLEEGGKTDNLIDSCKQNISYEDRILVVDIIAQSIQAEPVTAAEEAWGVVIASDTGILAPVTE